MATNNTERAMFEALPREATLASRVVRQMETMISQGGLGDGSRLPPERDLAAQFGVSRTVIREAVAALAARGLLEVQAGSGTVVRAPRVEAIARLVSLSLSIGHAGNGGIEQVRETARTLAGEVASLAAERRTEEDLEEIARAVRDVEVSLRSGAPERVLKAVALAAHNDISARLLDIVIQLGGKPVVTDSTAYRAVLDQIRKADPKSARRGVRDLFDVPVASAAAPKSSKKERKSA